MLRYILIFIVFSFVTNIYAQNQRDYLWLFGSDALALPKFEGSFIDFRNGGIDTSYKQVNTVTSSNHAIANDKQGNLLFYTNGCMIEDSSHAKMHNGDSLNYGKTWRQFCDPVGAYPGIQNSIILPDPANENGYYVVHKKRELMSDPYLFLDIDLLYTYVDMNENNELGKVLEKNVAFAPDISNIVNGYLRASQHPNGKDWWLIQMKYLDNWYYKILLDETGIAVVDSQQIGPKYTTLSGNAGQAVFSPDGNTWLLYNESDDVIIYDFDRETGDLSNLRQVAIQDSAYFAGAAISSNSRFAYLPSKYDLYQIDLWAEDVQESLIHIAHFDGYENPIGGTFHLAQLAPDCRIYITSPNQGKYLHVINKPNEKGKNCDFVQGGFKLPYDHLPASIPNFPHFRIDEEEICDSTISWVPELFLEKSPLNISISPNPASSEISVSAPEQYEWKEWSIFTIAGQQIRSGILKNEPDFKIHNLTVLESGVYFVKLRSAEGDIGVGKFVLQ